MPPQRAYGALFSVLLPVTPFKLNSKTTLLMPVPVTIATILRLRLGRAFTAIVVLESRLTVVISEFESALIRAKRVT